MKLLLTQITAIIIIIGLCNPAPAHGDDRNNIIQLSAALIASTCKNTPNYALCMATLQASSGSATADLTGLSLIMVDAVKAKTKKALAAIDQLSKKSSSYKKALETCTQVYKTVLKYDVSMAVEALTKGNPKFAENGMADAAVEADACENSFGGVFGTSPLAGVNKALSDISVVARAVIRNLL